VLLTGVARRAAVLVALMLALPAPGRGADADSVSASPTAPGPAPTVPQESSGPPDTVSSFSVRLESSPPDTAGSSAPPDSAASRSSIVPLPALFYSPETGLGGGALVLWTFRLGDSEASRRRPSTVTPLVLVTQKRQVVARITGDIYSRGGAWRFTGRFGGSRFPDRFWGIGNDTPEENDEDYTPETLEASVGAQRLLPRDWFVGAEAGWARRRLTDLEEGGQLESGLVPGAVDGRIVEIGLRARRDTRDWSIAPEAGGTLEVSAATHRESFGSDFTFDRWTVDLRRYHGIGRAVLAARALGEFTSAGDPPFDLLPALGGDSLLRGYYAGRFRDRHLAALQLELRIPIRWRVGAVVFGAAGQVAPEPDRFALAGVHPAAGLGLRFRPKEEDRTSLRFDWGFGDTGSGFYFALGEAF
jgi:hypothetical protein